MSDYTAALEKLAPGSSLPKTVAEERKLLKGLESVEQTSLDRVSESGIFAGLTRKLIDKGAKNVIASQQVELRKNFPQFLQHTQRRSQDQIHLLSVNWSRRFIDSCLRAAGAHVEERSIYANELDGIKADLPSTGRISPDGDADIKIISSSEKLEYMVRLRKEDVGSSRDPGPRPIVYVGDSWTDIECLLEADLGICVRDDPMGSSQTKLAERLQDLGIDCPHLQDWRNADEWKVVWARDFTEIMAWAKGNSAS